MNNDELRKAILDSSSGTTGDKLIPQVIDPYIVELARKISNLRNNLRRLPWDNETYTYKQRSANPVAKALGETDTWTFASSTYASQVATMKTIGQLGGVSNMLQEGSQRFVNAFMAEVDSVTKGCIKFEEHLFINGDSSADSNQFDGLIKAITTNAGYSSASAPAALGFDLLDAMDMDVKSRGFGIDQASVKWVMTPNMATVVARLTQPYYRQDGNPGNMEGGARAKVYAGKDIIESSAAEKVVKVSTETIAISSKVGSFAHNFVIKSTFDDQLGNAANAGTAIPGPVVTINSVAAVQGTDYTVSVNPFTGASTITLTSTPAGPVVATYFYRQQNILLLDLSTIAVPVLHELGFEKLADPHNLDLMSFRVKAYECLAVEAERGCAVSIEVHG